MALPQNALSTNQKTRLPLPPAGSQVEAGRVVAIEAVAGEKPRLIKASQELRRKAVNRSKGLDFVLPPEMKQRLEGVIAAAAPSFEQDILARLAELRHLLAGVGHDDFALIFLMPQLRELAFDIKGMAGTFGYHLLSDLAKGLKDFLEQIDMPKSLEFDLVAIHIDAIYVLLAQRITGQGGDLERQLLISLGYATDKVATH